MTATMDPALLPQGMPQGLPDSPARRRLIAVGVLLTLLATLALGVVLPVADHLAEAREHTDRQQALLSRLVALQDQAPALRRELAALEAELSAPEVVVRAPSASQAAAQLAATLRGVLEAEGVAMDSAQAIPTLPQGALLRVGLRFEFRTGIEKFHRIVSRIEAHRPNLVVGNALMTSRGSGSGADVLSIRMDVVAVAQVASAS